MFWSHVSRVTKQDVHAKLASHVLKRDKAITTAVLNINIQVYLIVSRIMIADRALRRDFESQSNCLGKVLFIYRAFAWMIEPSETKR